MSRSFAARPAVGKTLDLRVSSMRREAEGVLSLRLQAADGHSLPAWEPGAHIDLYLAPGITRQYSLCGDPADCDIWRIAVLLARESRGGSRFVHESIGEGDILSAYGPRNNFKLVDASEYLFVAGGIGITPILPMIRTASRWRKPWTLAYGGRSRNSMAFLAELQQYSGGKLNIMPEDEQGMLDLDNLLSQPRPGAAIYCCGPEPLLAAMEQRSICWPLGVLHTERFAPRTRALQVGEFEVEIAGTGERFLVPPDVSLLDVLESKGYAITNSCRAGICGTCLTKVINGVPEHNDDVLSDAERESNDVILPCVSRSKTDTLILDLSEYKRKDSRVI